jgi:hypothetical protein
MRIGRFNADLCEWRVYFVRSGNKPVKSGSATPSGPGHQMGILFALYASSVDEHAVVCAWANAANADSLQLQRAVRRGSCRGVRSRRTGIRRASLSLLYGNRVSWVYCRKKGHTFPSWSSRRLHCQTDARGWLSTLTTRRFTIDRMARRVDSSHDVVRARITRK